jgi:hypothetical protein
MANSQGDRDSGTEINKVIEESRAARHRLKIAIIQSRAYRISNGKFQVRRLYGVWCVITPDGGVKTYGTHPMTAAKRARMAAFAQAKYWPRNVH